MLNFFRFIVIFCVFLSINNQLLAKDLKKFNSDFKNYQHKIVILDQKNNQKASFDIQIADEEEERAYGLMNLRNNQLIFIKP